MTSSRSTSTEAQAANRLAPTSLAPSAKRSTDKGDVPQALLDRYLVERDGQGRAERFYRDHRSSDPMFRDRGGSLVSSHAYPDAVRDMLSIAQHRGWTRVRVAGDDAFRREVWIQAQSLGLEVAGHRPRERDRQAAGVPPAPDRSELSERLARAAVVVRHLIADPEVRARLLEGALARAHAIGRTRTDDRDRGG